MMDQLFFIFESFIGYYRIELYYGDIIMLENNQKAAYGIIAAVAMVMAVAKKRKMPTMSSARNPNAEDLSYSGLVEDIRMGSFAKHHQGYRDRMDESLGMRTGAQRNFIQSMKDRRNESYGKFGDRMMEHPHQNINR